MSKILDALRKAKGEQADSLFRPSTKNESAARAPKHLPTLPRAQETRAPESRADHSQTINLSSPPAEPMPVVNDAPANKISLPIDAPIKHARITVPKHPQLVALGEKSLASEQFFGLRAKVMVMKREQDLRIICVTSSVMGEGKTFVSTNLALTLAEESERGGILIDCDLRNPSVHRIFGIKEAVGLSGYLQTDRVNLDSIIFDTNHRLAVIPAGRIPKNPLTLLDSAKLKELIAHLRERYDFVVLDAPPTAPLPDSDLLASLSDGLLFVIRASQTPLTIIQRSLKMLSRRNIIGSVLNATNEMPSYSYYYSYGQKPELRQ
jgi:capsular exopolysaccharide synthesis family protein